MKKKRSKLYHELKADPKLKDYLNNVPAKVSEKDLVIVIVLFVMLVILCFVK